MGVSFKEECGSQKYRVFNMDKVDFKKILQTGFILDFSISFLVNRHKSEVGGNK